MSGTRSGGLRAAQTNIDKYGKEFYKMIGAKGGSVGRTGGFAAGEEGRERAKVYGAIGGSISRRGPSTEGKKPAIRKDGHTQAEFLTAKYQRHLENVRADQQRIRKAAEQKLKQLEELRNQEAELERKLKGGE